MQPAASRPSPAAGLLTRRRAKLALAAWLLCLGAGKTLFGGEPAPSDELLKLVPADAGLIVTVDRLREQSRAILDSQLFEDVRGLPVFQAWLGAEKVRDFERSRGQIEGFLETSFGEVRDEILGDAVVLALRLPADKADPAEARGLLVLKARDPKLLERLVGLVNSTQQQNGEIADLSEQRRGSTVYLTRTFHPGDDHMPESFVIFPDGTFAFSNAESLIHEVIDRKTKAGTPMQGSVADRPSFRSTAARLPAGAAARLFVEPSLPRRLLGRLPAPNSDEDRGFRTFIERYVGGLDYVGAALVIRDQEIKIQAVQAFQPDRFRELAGTWLSNQDSNRPGSRLLTVPTSTLALMTLNINFPSLYRTLTDLVPAADRPRIAKLETLAEGLLLGLDVRRRVVPALGPRVVAYIEPPDFSNAKDDAATGRFPFPTIVAAEIDEEAVRHLGTERSPTVAAALDNALKTVFAALSLDEKRVPASGHIEVHELDGATVTSLSTPYPFAYAVDHAGRRLVLGNSPEAVTRYLEAGGDPRAGARFQAIRSAAFPDRESYGCIDLAAIHDLVVKHRERLIESTARKEQRSASDVGRDLDQVLGLVGLFDAAFVTARADADDAVLEHTVGLLPLASYQGR